MGQNIGSPGGLALSPGQFWLNNMAQVVSVVKRSEHPVYVWMLSDGAMVTDHGSPNIEPGWDDSRGLATYLGTR